jgi:hypothetical protein
MLIGWDVSTSAIGVCVKDDAGKTLLFHVIFPAGDTHLEKYRSAVDQIDGFLSHYVGSGEPITHVVEERLGGFTGGMTSKQTLMTLAAMNAVTAFHLSSTGRVTYLAPVTTKRIMGLKKDPGEDKKAAVVRLARSAEPTFPYRETKAGNYAKGIDDMADAWLLAEAWLRVIRGEATVGQKRKAGRGRGKAGPAEVRGPGQGRVRLPVPKPAV